MQERLDRARKTTGDRHIVVGSDSTNALRSALDISDYGAQVDPHLNVLASLYILMCDNPVIFCDKPDRPDEVVWGFSHEDWFRASCVLVVIKSRRVKQVQDKDTVSVGPGKPKGKGRAKSRVDDTEDGASDAVFHGYATPDIVALTERAAGDPVVLARMQFAARSELYDQGAEDKILASIDWTSDTPERLASSIQFINSLRNAREAHELLQGPALTSADLAAAVADLTADRLHSLAPGADLHQALVDTVPEERRLAPIRSDERDAIIRMLGSNFTIKRYGSSLTTKPGGDATSCAAVDASRLRAVEVAESDAIANSTADDEACENDTVDMDALRKVREGLGEILPEQQDIERACLDLGIALGDLTFNKHNESMKAKPAQIIGKFPTSKALGYCF